MLKPKRTLQDRKITIHAITWSDFNAWPAAWSRSLVFVQPHACAPRLRQASTNAHITPNLGKRDVSQSVSIAHHVEASTAHRRSRMVSAVQYGRDKDVDGIDLPLVQEGAQDAASTLYQHVRHSTAA